MTEHESLTLAKWYVQKAQEVLRLFKGGSFAADEAYKALMVAVSALVDGLEITEPEGLTAPPVDAIADWSAPYPDDEGVTWIPSRPASEVYADPTPEAR